MIVGLETFRDGLRGTLLLATGLGCWCLATAAVAQTGIPTSSRSRAAVGRTSALLDRDLSAKGLSLGSPIFIRIFKESSDLEVWVEQGSTFYLFRTYPICAFSGDLGPKLVEGDQQAPEGFYFVTPEKLNPLSQFHLSFNLGYPNAYDRYHGRTGSNLMVHGNCVSIGCYAMTDERIEEIYTLAAAAFRGGQPFFRVHLFPFRMEEELMREHESLVWRGFWKNLREGYEHFEEYRRPPNVEVGAGRYLFELE